jgi:zinc protease
MRKSRLEFILAIVLLIFLSAGCVTEKEEQQASLSVDFEKYELENGLDVILHQDHSDPIVSLAVVYHVGSGREKTGRTGFAHLFEHMLFQQSENVPQDQFFKIVQDAGGTLNGFTFEDGTAYFEVVPKSAFETVMWLESDRMGFFKNTITESALANQQDVVINEKRQRVDNNPYGHTSYVINKAIFPEGHPYSWQVIGEMEDLKDATVDDVKEFYDNFYGPNNATLVLAGDFELDSAKVLVEKYFGEIKKSREVPAVETQNVTLSETKKLYHEDNFANMAQLNMVWPSAEQYSDDGYALNFLAHILSDGKKAPLYKVLVKEKELTTRTIAYNNEMELAGMFRISITANPGVSLNDVHQAIFEAFERLETDSITETDLERVKAGLETNFYNQLQSILNKSFQLAFYDVFAGNADYVEKDIERIRAVTIDDVWRVYNKYVKDKPYVVTSFVPKGQLDMIVEGSKEAPVVEEKISENVEVAEAEDEELDIKKTPSAFDRSTKPAEGTPPGMNLPETWTATLENGLKVYGIENMELPLVEFALVLDGGHQFDTPEKNGVANLMTDIMMEGTATKTPEELEEEIDLLGSRINMSTSSLLINVRASSLSRNFYKTITLVEELLLQPRWDEEEFDRIKTKTINDLKRSQAYPGYVSGIIFNEKVYGDDHIMSLPTSGTPESIEGITIDDLKSFYDSYYTPNLARIHVVGNISQEDAMKALEGLGKNWEPKEVEIPTYNYPSDLDKKTLYFVDIPDAKQSVINIGYLAMAREDPDYYPATVMNYKLGGSFSGNVNLVLREEKGYTYGARTYFSDAKIRAPFTASSSVRTNVTYESVQIFKQEMEKYREGVSEEDLEFTKNSMIKSNALAMETLWDKMEIIRTMSSYGWDATYLQDEEDIIRNMTLEQHKELAQKYIDPDKMIYVVVGDAATQYTRLKNAGFDEVYLLDKEGNPTEVIKELEPAM